MNVDLTGFEGETERMRLRPYAFDDHDEFADLHGRDDVARYLPWETRDDEASRMALERHQALALEQNDDGVTLAGFDKDTGRLVGEFVLFLRSIDHRGGEVGYVLHPDFQGRGLATEGAAAMLRLGMRREARLVRNEWFKGEWTDEEDFALLEDEWTQQAHPRLTWRVPGS